MSDPCWSCRERPAASPDGRCETCAAAGTEHLPTQIAPSKTAPPTHAPTQVAPSPAAQPGPHPAYPQPQPQLPPPGAYAPYPGGAGYPMLPPQFVSPRGLATALTVLLGVCIGLWSIATIADGRMSAVLTGMEDGERSAWEDFDAANDFYAGAGVLQLLGGLATGIVFIIWFHRTRVNAELFDPAGHRRSRGWAVGGWFVPVVNLWFPKQIANDTWRASTPWGASPKRGVLTAWWVLWIISFVFGFLGAVVGSENDGVISTQDELDSAQSEVAMTVLSDLTGIAAAILALLFVRRLTQRQLVKFEQGPQAAPYPPQQPAGPAPYPYGGGPVPPYGA